MWLSLSTRPSTCMQISLDMGGLPFVDRMMLRIRNPKWSATETVSRDTTQRSPRHGWAERQPDLFHQWPFRAHSRRASRPWRAGTEDWHAASRRRVVRRPTHIHSCWLLQRSVTSGDRQTSMKQSLRTSDVVLVMSQSQRFEIRMSIATYANRDRGVTIIYRKHGQMQ